MFEVRPMPALQLAVSLLLCAAISACMTTSTVLTQRASPCMKILLASGLLDPTPGAQLALIDGSAGGDGAFGLAQTGQLVKANIDKRTAKAIGTSCDAEWTAALKAARPRKRFLGLF